MIRVAFFDTKSYDKPSFEHYGRLNGIEFKFLELFQHHFDILLHVVKTLQFARILCIADSFDAMTSDRVYRGRLSKEQVVDEIEKNRGTQFAPEVADTVLAMIKDGILMC